MDIFRKRTDIPRIFLEHECIFLRVNVTFYDAVNIPHDFITTPNPPPYYTAKLWLSVLDIIKLNKSDVER